MKLAINQATLMKTSMESFLEETSGAGFEGVELRRHQIFEYLKSHSVNELSFLLKRNELDCITFNAVELFSLCPQNEFEHILKYTEQLMEIGIQIDCKTIITVPSFMEKPIDDKLIIVKTVERLKQISKLAAIYDFKLGFEPLGFPNCSVRKLDLALKIINHDDLPEMGLIIDTFHFFVGEHSISELNKIPLEKLWLIHINDAIQKPFKELQDSHRVLPFQGFFNLQLFIDKVKEIGYNGWLSLELFNEKLWELSPTQVTKEAMISLKKLIF